MRPREYSVLEMAVEQGVKLGWRRAYKYEDAPLVEDVQRRITEDVLNAICEWFTFDDDYGVREVVARQGPTS